MAHQFKTIDIRGKQYVQVHERVLFFRTDSAYKGFSLLSEVVSFTDEQCIVKATIRNAEGREVATGLAHETRTASSINKTSMLENCETSAWGRALGNLGIGIETSIATAEEVAQAIAQQEEKPEKKAKPAPALSNAPEVSAEQLRNLQALAKAGGVSEDILAKLVGGIDHGKGTYEQAVAYLQSKVTV